MYREKVYYGEPYRNAYSRGEEHLDKYHRKTKDSVMWRHCRLDHDSEIQNFTMLLVTWINVRL